MRQSSTQVLWPFTQKVIQEINNLQFQIPKIDMHDPDDPEGSDLIWGLVTPELSLSEGEVLAISHYQGQYCATFLLIEAETGNTELQSETNIENKEQTARALAQAFVLYFSQSNSI